MSAAECFAPAFKAGDADAVAACYADDAVMWFPGGPMARGRADIRDGFAGYFAGSTIKDMQLTLMGQEMVGDTRATWGTFVATSVDNKTGVETRETGRFNDLARKIDGRWLYVVDHASDDPEATP